MGGWKAQVDELKWGGQESTGMEGGWAGLLRGKEGGSWEVLSLRRS